MAVSGDIKVFVALSSHKFNSLSTSTHFLPSKVNSGVFINFTSNASPSAFDAHNLGCHSKHPLGILPEYKISQNPHERGVGELPPECY